MAELEAMTGQRDPHTVASLSGDLRALGLPSGATVLVHSSMAAIGWVSGGAVAVAQALVDVLGPAGTLVAPTQSGGLSDPATWSRPPIPEAWWQQVRDSMPAYDAATTPTRGMGAVVEVVRNLPGFARSDHPQVSFGAVGPAATAILHPHPLSPGLGAGSPLSRLAESGALTLLLGVGWESATCLHLGEARSGIRAQVPTSAPVLVDGHRQWATWSDVDWDAADFPAVGTQLESTGAVLTGRVGSASARLVGIADAADAAERWFRLRPVPQPLTPPAVRPPT